MDDFALQFESNEIGSDKLLFFVSLKYNKIVSLSIDGLNVNTKNKVLFLLNPVKHQIQ